MAATKAQTDKRIESLGNLIALALVLITVFTAQRWAANRDRQTTTGLTRFLILGGAAVDFALFLVTSCLTLAAAPLFRDAVCNHQVLHAAGAIRSTFVIVWLLLVGLVIWQAAIFGRTARQVPRVRRWL